MCAHKRKNYIILDASFPDKSFFCWCRAKINGLSAFIWPAFLGFLFFSALQVFCTVLSIESILERSDLSHTFFCADSSDFYHEKVAFIFFHPFMLDFSNLCQYFPRIHPISVSISVDFCQFQISRDFFSSFL